VCLTRLFSRASQISPAGQLINAKPCLNPDNFASRARRENGCTRNYHRQYGIFTSRVVNGCYQQGFLQAPGPRQAYELIKQCIMQPQMLRAARASGGPRGWGTAMHDQSFHVCGPSQELARTRQVAAATVTMVCARPAHSGVPSAADWQPTD
jgi:hypothetical protein